MVRGASGALPFEDGRGVRIPVPSAASQVRTGFSLSCRGWCGGRHVVRHLVCWSPAAAAHASRFESLACGESGERITSAA